MSWPSSSSRYPSAARPARTAADIRLVRGRHGPVLLQTHVDTFAIVSGDSDFSPLVSKLKENGKRVIGLGMKASTSDLLRDNCDEFVYYEDLERQRTSQPPALPKGLPKEKREAFNLLIQSLLGPACGRTRKFLLFHGQGHHEAQAAFI